MVDLTAFFSAIETVLSVVIGASGIVSFAITIIVLAFEKRIDRISLRAVSILCAVSKALLIILEVSAYILIAVLAAKYAVRMHG